MNKSDGNRKETKYVRQLFELWNYVRGNRVGIVAVRVNLEQVLASVRGHNGGSKGNVWGR